MAPIRETSDLATFVVLAFRFFKAFLASFFSAFSMILDGFFFIWRPSVQLDPNTRSLINAACAQVQASSSKARLYASFVVLDDPHMASSANCRNTLASDMIASAALCWHLSQLGRLRQSAATICVELLTAAFRL